MNLKTLVAAAVKAGRYSVHRLVRIIEACPTCKGEGELECLHADLFRCPSCRGTGKNKTFRLGKVWGLGLAFEIYNEDYEYTAFRLVAACKIYAGPLLVNLRIPIGKAIYPNGIGEARADNATSPCQKGN